jgi:hypothetical protein
MRRITPNPPTVTDSFYNKILGKNYARGSFGKTVATVGKPSADTSGEREYASVKEFFADPPGWLSGQLRVYWSNPERHFGPLCHTLAAAVLGDSLRGAEVAEEVRSELDKDVVEF